MSADRRSRPGDRKHMPAGRRGRADSPYMLMPAAIVTFGAADRPVGRLMGLQSTMARAVQVAVEIRRVPDFLMSRWSRCRRALDVLRAGGSALTQH